MASLPAHVPTEFSARAREDSAARIAELGVPAVYRAGGNGEGVNIVARVSAGPIEGRNRAGAGGAFPPGGGAGSNAIFNQSLVQVLAATGADGAVAGGAVAGLLGVGGVVRLAVGDTVTVRGEVFALASAYARLAVNASPGPRLVEGAHWNAACSVQEAASA